MPTLSDVRAAADAAEAALAPDASRAILAKRLTRLRRVWLAYLANAADGATLLEVARMLGVTSKERARQIERDAMRRFALNWHALQATGATPARADDKRPGRPRGKVA
jgi:DNA-directed RNA polymerase sigma subunit (sigma70/sigma32)